MSRRKKPIDIIAYIESKPSFTQNTQIKKNELSIYKQESTDDLEEKKEKDKQVSELVLDKALESKNEIESDDKCQPAKSSDKKATQENTSANVNDLVKAYLDYVRERNRYLSKNKE